MLRSIFKSHLLFLSGLMLITATNAQAQPGCDPGNTVVECQEHVRQEQERLLELKAGKAPALLDIARNGDGSINYMYQSDAIQYCANQGAHLPSARELARYSMSLGTKGIAEVGNDAQNAALEREGYYRVHALNADGTQDSFYFSRKGYHSRPAGDLHSIEYWSSSIHSKDSDYAVAFLGGNLVYVVHYWYVNKLAVRCMSGR